MIQGCKLNSAKRKQENFLKFKEDKNFNHFPGNLDMLYALI
jgi:hypothetical protein